ncbi:MAG: radical SAM protein [Lachnospiraceae bacterium]|nr:radical SAM protein [Lachnospiraceae bacterium]
MIVENKYLSLPLTAQFEVTDFCNHRCIHCYNLDSETVNRPIHKVKDETVLACAQKLIDNKIFSVVVTGGEPLIKKDLTKKVILLLKRHDIKVSLNSNLVLLDDDFIKFIKTEEVGILTSCPSAINTSFEKLVGVDNYLRFEANVKKLVAANIRFIINMVITKENINEIITTAQKMQQLGCKSFAATPMGLNMEYPRLDLLLSSDEVRKVVADLLWINDNLGLRVDILEALPKCAFPENILLEKHVFLNRKCQAGRTGIAVSSNGDVRPCAHNTVSYGNILQEDLKEIWTKMQDWRSLQYIPKICKDCTWLNHCNGGCRTNAKTISDKWDGMDIWCARPPIKQPARPHKDAELTEETYLQVNANYQYRQDDENCFVIYNVDDDIYFMVNRLCFDFITSFRDKERFTYAQLMMKYRTNDNKAFREVVLFLIRKRILTIN